ncbi:MAG: helix-turn-helix domain-containing protein [Planctomycetota bacterium]|jgi:AraC-like DNA-binding protein
MAETATLLSCSHFVSSSKETHSPTSQSSERILVITGGEYCARTGDQLILARSGDVVCIPRLQSGVEWNPPGTSLACQVIRCHWQDRPTDLPLRVQDRHSAIRFLALRLAAVDESSEHGGRIRSDYLQAILGEYLLLASQEMPDLIHRVQTFIQEHLEVPLSLPRVADHIGLSQHHFGRLYRRLTGKTPMQEVRSIRLERARELILTTRLPLKQIGIQVGIPNITHLSRLFRRHFGLSVREMRRMTQDS